MPEATTDDKKTSTPTAKKTTRRRSSSRRRMKAPEKKEEMCIVMYNPANLGDELKREGPFLYQYEKEVPNAATEGQGRELVYVSFGEGVNEVPYSVWQLIEDELNEVVVEKLDTGALYLFDENLIGEEINTVGIDDERKALRLVTNCWKVDLLRRWLQKEHRTKVIDKINVNLRKLSPEEQAKGYTSGI